jgi:hypothetical protein
MFTGAVTSVFPTGDSRSRTFTVKVRPDDPDGGLKPGMYAQLSVTLDQRTNVPVIPRDAIIVRADKPYVFVVADNVAQLRTLELGLSDDKKSEVKTGVQPDETIVVNGQASLRDKDAVRVVQPGQSGGAGSQGGAPVGGRPSGQGAPGSSGQGAGGQGGAPSGGQGGDPSGGQGGDPSGGQGGAPSGGQGGAPSGGQGGAPSGGQGGAPSGGQRPAGASQGGARSGGEALPTPTKAP